MSIGTAIQASKAQISRPVDGDGSSAPSQPGGGQGNDPGRIKPDAVQASTDSPPSIAGGLAQSPTTTETLFQARTNLDLLRGQPWPPAEVRANPDTSPTVIPFLPSGNRSILPDVVSEADLRTRDQWLHGAIRPIGIPPGPADTVGTDAPVRHPYDRSAPRAIELDKPDAGVLDLSAEALANGDIDEALDAALNSEGDSVAVRLSVDVSIPTPYGPSVGVDTALEVQLQRTAGGKYEVSLTTEQAVSLGLEVSDELKAQAELGFETRAVYRFNSRDEAIDGLKDLAITAGGVSTSVSDRVSDLERVGNFGKKVSNNSVVDFLGDAVDVVLPGTGTVVDLGQDAASVFETVTDIVNDTVGDAQERLDDAFVSYEVSGVVGRELNVGLPDSQPGSSIDLGIELAVDQTFTTRVNSDGSVIVSVSQEGTSTVNTVGPGGTTASASGQTSVTVTHEFVKVDGGLTTTGSPTVTLVLDTSTKSTVGDGVTNSTGTGQRLTYEFDASELLDGGREAVDRFLRGDAEGALEALGDVEGDLTVQARTTSSLNVEADFSRRGAGVEVEGSLVATDQGEATRIEDISLSEVVDLVDDELPELADVFGGRF